MMMMVGERSSINRHPFTATQWKELELQTLIFNYMASGIPIPSHLILPLRRSFYFLDHFPLHPAMSSGRKTEHDLEPGRCRRTDGKKWRCSKEASPDSKYCERHMHRGKKCSRKQVEMPLITSTPTPNYYSHISSTSPYPPPLSMYSYSSHSKTQSFLGFSHQNNTTHLYLGTASYSPPDKSSRYYNGSKEDVNENTNFFSEESREERDSSWWFRPLGMSSLGEPKQSTYSYFSKDQIKEEEQNQHCFVMGTDLKLEKSVKVDREEETQRPMPLLCFFNECPEKNKDSCMDSEEWGSPDVYSKTQLSISIPWY